MFFAKLHPLLVHFPVGLFVSGALFELYGNFRGEKTVAEAGAFNVWFGFWCSLPVALIGFLAFGEKPDMWTWLGAAVIVLSSVYITHREQRLGQEVPSGKTANINP